jgi:hypothetical protein
MLVHQLVVQGHSLLGVIGVDILGKAFLGSERIGLQVFEGGEHRDAVAVVEVGFGVYYGSWIIVIDTPGTVCLWRYSMLCILS